MARRIAWRIDQSIRNLFITAQRIVEYAVAAFLMAFGVFALINTFREVQGSLRESEDWTFALTQGIDATLLTIILLELLNTVLSRAPIIRRLQEFLIVGIFSAIRYSLEIVAGARRPPVVTANAPTLTHQSRDIVIDLTINALGIFVLVVALWLIRRRTISAADDPPAPTKPS